MNSSSMSSPLMPISYSDQDSVFARPFEILRAAIVRRAFPAVAIAVTHAGEIVALKACGRFTFEPNSHEAMPNTIFDLASVSKVVATTTMAMILYERGLLDLDAPIVAILPEFAGSDSRRKTITVRMLLAHSSGLPAYGKFFLLTSSRDELLSLALTADLVSEPGTRAEYSDIGFIILGALLERVADESLVSFCQREIFGALGMTQTMFNPPTALRPLIPPTADDRSYRRRQIQGEVQDENASAMGGVAGHAGVFSSAGDLAIFANAMLQRGNHLVRQETLDMFTRKEIFPAGTSRALGWDTPSLPSQSGKYFSLRSYGHLGYTGTSLWIDPERHLAIVVLTNRTWPDCSNQSIKTVRPAFHDAVVEALHLEVCA